MIGDAAAVVADARKARRKQGQEGRRPHGQEKPSKPVLTPLRPLWRPPRRSLPKKPGTMFSLPVRIDMEDLANQAKASFKEEHKRTAVMSCRVYLKPEDSAAYYVINDTCFGRIDL